MKKSISDESIKFIVSRILENAGDAIDESNLDKDNGFALGRKLAYYEVLDVLRSELDVREVDLTEMGLNLDLEKMF